MYTPLSLSRLSYSIAYVAFQKVRMPPITRIRSIRTSLTLSPRGVRFVRTGSPPRENMLSWTQNGDSHKTMMISRLRKMFVVAFTALVVLPCVAQPWTKSLADGVTLTQDISTDSTSAMIVNVLRIDPKKPGVKITAALCGDTVVSGNATKGRETISSLVARKGALAGVNADFFPWTGDPLGLMITDGELVSEPMDRAVVGITAAGTFLFDRLSFEGSCKTASGLTYPIRGINRERGRAEMVLFTPIFGATNVVKDGVGLVLTLNGPVKANTDITATAASDPGPGSGASIPTGGAVLSASGGAADWLKANVHKGDKLTIRMSIKSASGKSWDTVVEAAGGGPQLVRDGQVFVDAVDERFKPDVVIGRNPRTAVGATASGELLLVTVDGRQAISRGVSLQELAELMKKLGAVQAINLDGGGSTTLSVKGLVINSPSGGAERPVADALLVYAPTPPADASDLKFADSGPISLTSSDNRMLSLIDSSTGKPATDQALSNVTWGTRGGIGFVNQRGYFTPFKAGAGTIVAMVGDKRVELPVTVLPSAPAKLSLNTEPDSSGSVQLVVLNVTVTDSKDNGTPGVPVTVTITGGAPDAPTKPTDAKGVASFTLTLDTTLNRAKISVAAAGMTAEVK
jgi:exopolysaccharide biosynthesis protein